MSSMTASARLVERMCRPQCIGVFGHRGVGKTTLLTMIYREAVGGRLHGLRLGSADATTANYLRERILQLEQGEALPATLGETDLQFRLSHQGNHHELLMRDYQGEHVALGAEQPIGEHLADCDALWICLDPGSMENRADNIQRQQEVEQTLECYLKLNPEGGLQRPMALVITKSDALKQSGEDAQASLYKLVNEHLGMTAHALREHAPGYEFFAVSALGRDLSLEGELEPKNLELPLRWLSNALLTQDEARMERILADSKISIADKQRCIQAFADRYPSSEKIAEYQQELNQAKKRRRRVRVALAAVLFLILGFGAYLYDRLNYDKIQRLAAEKPQEALTKLKEFQKWHPTRHLFAVTTPQEEEALERQLQTSIVEHRKEELVARLRAILKDSPLAKFDEVLTLTAKYRSETKAPLPDDLLILEADCRERAAETDLEELQREEGRLTPSEQGVVFVKNDPWIKSMNTLVTHADGLLKKHASTRAVSFIRKARDSYLSRLDEHDYDIARAYSRRNPQSFQTRLERYRTYLERHPQGAYVTQVKEAIEAVDRLWDKHDFRAVRDHFRDKPKELKTLVALSEKYLLIHPKGKYRSHANELLRWAARVKGEREYQVTLVRGDFDSGKTRRWYTKGPDFAITIEVNGVRYGPSSIVKNNYHPEWKYTFPRPIRWKMGDKVRIIAIDYDYWNIKTLDHSSREGDVLSMCLLSGRTHANGHTLYFSSDFWVPKMPVLD